MKYNDTERLVREGQVQQAIENYNSILESLKRALAQNVAKKQKDADLEAKQAELHHRVAYGVAELYYRSKDYDKGLQHVERMLGEQPRLSEQQRLDYKLLKGKALDMKGDYSTAVEVFRENLRDYLRYIQQQQGEAAEKGEVIGNLEFRYGWALIRSKKDVELGVQQLRAAQEKMPDNLDLKIKLALILFQEQAKPQEAKDCLDETLKVDPAHQEALHLYGKVLLKEKNFKKAEEMIQRAIDSAKKNGEQVKAGSYYHLG